jgi:hypothetical protein
MHSMFPGPQECSQVYGGGTGVHNCICRSTIDFNAVKLMRCPADNSARTEQAEPSKMKTEKRCIFVA